MFLNIKQPLPIKKNISSINIGKNALSITAFQLISKKGYFKPPFVNVTVEECICVISV